MILKQIKRLRKSKQTAMHFALISISMAILLLCLLALVSCSGSSRAEIDKFIAEIKSRPAKKIEPIPTFKPYQKEHYTAHQLRDPFVRSTKTSSSILAPSQSRPKGPLELFPIDALKMVGTITKDGQVWALISVPDGTVYPVTVGTYVGQNYGRIVSITANKVNIEETVRIEDNWQKRPIAMTLIEESAEPAAQTK